MIDPLLLTEENGFVGGEWIEIEHHVMRWHGLEIYDEDYLNWIIDEYENINPAYVINIRPLTGPMSIWNHAPDWAEYVVTQSDRITWYDKDHYDKEADKVGKRPFWAKVKE